jgi:hypothetical protein
MGRTGRVEEIIKMQLCKLGRREVYCGEGVKNVVAVRWNDGKTSSSVHNVMYFITVAI